MNAPPDYELVDFGNGRKLESLGGYLIDRPSPAAIASTRALPEMWRAVDARFDDVDRHWSYNRPWPDAPDAAFIDGGSFRLPLRATPFGHIGAFPEQRSNWKWLADVAVAMAQAMAQAISQTARVEADPPVFPTALNLFAHTGGSTLALAATGAEVVHVDAAKPSVQAAREAATASNLSDAKIRYIVDDAMKFTAREVRRRRRYNIVVLDPPAYGHSPAGKAWRIDRDLWPLIDASLELLCPSLGALLITGHTEGIDQAAISEYVTTHQKRQPAKARMLLNSGRSQLTDRSGRKLDAGFFVRANWS